MAHSSIFRTAAIGMALLLWLAAAVAAEAGTVSGRMAVGATVVSSCSWRTQPLSPSSASGAVVPAVVSRCAGGVSYAASIHADPALAQIVKLQRTLMSGADGSSPGFASPALLPRSEAGVPAAPPGWGDARAPYVTINY